jgi:ATP-dependent Zn protease
MVGAAGMADTLISFAAIETTGLSGANLVARVLGDSEGRRMVEDLLREQKEQVRELLGEQRHLVEALRDALLERHELIGHEIGDVSTGPGGDLLYATNCAAEMIGAHGMTDTLVSYLAIQNSAFSDTNIVGRVLADERGRAAVDALLQEQKRAVTQLLSEHRHLVEALRDALLARHELVGTEITDVLEAAARGRVIDLTEQPEVVAD